MTSEITQPPKQTLTQLLFLVIASVMLCVSRLMAVFTPFPLSLSILLFGVRKASVAMVLGISLSVLFSLFIYSDITMVIFYLFMCIIAGGLAFCIHLELRPVKGVIYLASSIILMVALVVGFILANSEVGPVEMVAQQTRELIEFYSTSEEGKALIENLKSQNLLEKPEVLAQNIVENAPSFFIMSILLMVWVNMYLVLRSRRLLDNRDHYKQSEGELINFKVPFSWVYLLIIGFLLLLIGEDYLQFDKAEVIGISILRILGIFYFFQGLGILLIALNLYRIIGFFRTIIIMMIVFFAPYALALTGLFDTWFDFRKVILKYKNRGEKK